MGIVVPNNCCILKRRRNSHVANKRTQILMHDYKPIRVEGGREGGGGGALEGKIPVFSFTNIKNTHAYVLYIYINFFMDDNLRASNYHYYYYCYYYMEHTSNSSKDFFFSSHPPFSLNFIYKIF